MSISMQTNSYPILQHASKQMNSAASDIASYSKQPQPSNSTIKSTISTPESERTAKVAKNAIAQHEAVQHKQAVKSQIDPLIKLNQASQYSRVGTNVIQRQNTMLGSLIDTHS